MPLNNRYHVFIMDNEYRRYYFNTTDCKIFEIVLDTHSNTYKLVATDKVITCTSTELSWDKPFVLIYPWTNFLKERRRQLFLYTDTVYLRYTVSVVLHSNRIFMIYQEIRNRRFRIS